MARNEHVSLWNMIYSIFQLATKIISKFHGYESTLKGVKDSLARLELGEDSPRSTQLSLMFLACS